MKPEFIIYIKYKYTCDLTSYKFNILDLFVHSMYGQGFCVRQWSSQENNPSPQTKVAVGK